MAEGNAMHGSLCTWYVCSTFIEVYVGLYVQTVVQNVKIDILFAKIFYECILCTAVCGVCVSDIIGNEWRECR